MLRNVRRRLIGAIGMILVSAGAFEIAFTTWTTRQEDDIREAVFRYRINQRPGGLFFLGIEGKDPGDAFMARFASVDQKVGKISQSYFKLDPPPGWLRDRSTDQQGVLFSVGHIRWLSPHRVEVRGGMYCGGLCADAGVYRLEKKEHGWIVVAYDVEMVS
jgi:hypothetical protein